MNTIVKVKLKEVLKQDKYLRMNRTNGRVGEKIRNSVIRGLNGV